MSGEPKKCLFCKMPFYRRKGEGFEQWDNRKYCSHKCSCLFVKAGLSQPIYVPRPDDIEGEVWRTCTENENYEVSDAGRVRRAVIYSKYMRGKVLKPSVDDDGYLYVRLSEHSKLKAHRINRLVATAFIGPQPEGKPLVCHNNSIRNDNRSDNLRWDDDAGNCKDQIAFGTHPSGENNPNCKLSDLQVRVIRERFVYGDSKAYLARVFEVSETQISKIVKGELRREAGGFL